MSATLRWIVERRLLTLAGFGVILVGAFIPWPSLAIAAVVIVLGAVLLAVQIPIAMRDATEQLDGVDEPDQQWQAPTYPQYQPEAYQQPSPSVQPELSAQVTEPTPLWQPQNIPQFPPAQPSWPRVPSEQPAPQPQPTRARLPGSPRRMYEPAPVWQPKNIAQAPQPESPEEPRPAQQPEPSRRPDEPAVPWRPQNIPQYRPER